MYGGDIGLWGGGVKKWSPDVRSGRNLRKRRISPTQMRDYNLVAGNYFAKLDLPKNVGHAHFVKIAAYPGI